ncbi:hypothetical protein C8R48DRAFT_782978 [Suillus tomentosus]|nr:hypothetical protein C8R48DRAFT_782978 [Suillus tomentosus]
MRPNATARPEIDGTTHAHRPSLSFADSPALERTPHGMATFRALESETGLPRISNGYGSSASTNDCGSEADEALMSMDNDFGEKRKLNGSSYGPRKCARLVPAPFAPIPTADDPNSSWCPSQPFVASTPHPQFLSIEKYKDKGTLAPNILLTIMNTNIKTLKRVRRMHAKFTALNLNVEEGGMGDELPDIGEEGRVDEVIDERPWRARYADLGQVKGSVELEVSEKNADECLKWMNRKVIEHKGFQGTSSVALDVMVGVTSEYLLNVGRMLRLMCDKYAKSMTPEEIILHTLFESGIAKIQDLELYIKDDVIRHGSRLINLEKKLVGAYRKAVELIDNGALLAGEDYEGDNSAFVTGGFYDSLGDDFLGLRELGVAAELGLSSLTIPQKLLKGKLRGTAGGAIEYPLSNSLREADHGTLVIDRKPRVGDSRRDCYKALCLHVTIWYNRTPYLNFPPTWPVYTPAEKVQYYSHDVWTASTITKTSWNDSTRVLTVKNHIFATGSGSRLKVPDIPGKASFKGSAVHSSEFNSAADHIGKTKQS